MRLHFSAAELSLFTRRARIEAIWVQVPWDLASYSTEDHNIGELCPHPSGALGLGEGLGLSEEALLMQGWDSETLVEGGKCI